jgi:enoyl-CoA hydratase/carnithine racemase
MPTGWYVDVISVFCRYLEEPTSRESEGTVSHVHVDAPARGVARITLARPDRHNAVNAAMGDDLLAAERHLVDDPAVHVILYRGDGPSFCTGRDLKDYPGERDRTIQWIEEGSWCRPWRIPKVTIAQVHGYAIGGGALMATLCDITVAAPDARFAYPELRMGMEGADSHPWVHLIGAKRAKSLLLTGRQFSAAEAWTLGLISEVAPSTESLEETALERATQVAEMEAKLPGSSGLAKLDVNAEHPELLARTFVNPEATERRLRRAELEYRLKRDLSRDG